MDVCHHSVRFSEVGIEVAGRRTEAQYNCLCGVWMGEAPSGVRGPFPSSIGVNDDDAPLQQPQAQAPKRLAPPLSESRNLRGVNR